MRQVATDPHSPARYRVIGVLVNNDDFTTAYDVAPGDRDVARAGPIGCASGESRRATAPPGEPDGCGLQSSHGCIKWSIASEGSPLSIGSVGSVLSIGSVGSALSIGSVASLASALLHSARRCRWAR